MLALLLKHSFSDYDKKQKPRLDDWGNIKGGIIACEKYSLLTWSDYAFYTQHALYYHCKKQGVHTLLHYSGINNYDGDTEIIDYGSEHKKISISQWETGVKNFIKQIANIKTITDERNTSVLEFCFNHCRDFKNELRFFKTNEIKNAFESQCQRQHATELLWNNFEKIQIRIMEDKKIILRYCVYFPKVERVYISENDSEYDRHEKEIEQERLYEKAAARIEEAQMVSEQLPIIKDDIILLFKETIYNLYGVHFEKENVCFLEEPEFTYEESILDKVQSKVAPVQSVVDSMMESTAKQMADIERKYNKNKQ